MAFSQDAITMSNSQVPKSECTPKKEGHSSVVVLKMPLVLFVVIRQSLFQIADDNLRFERTRNSSGLSYPNQSFLSDVSTLPSGIDPPGEENIYEDPETFSRDV